MNNALRIIFLSLFLAAQAHDDYEYLGCEIKLICRPGLHEQLRGMAALRSRLSATGPYTHPHVPLARAQDGSSLNWSGYVVAPTAQKASSVTGVVGTWTVPVISPSAQKTHCAIWVGIDGYTSPTVEQIGTEHDWSNGKQSHYAWFEMYPAVSYQIVGFPVDSGDSITATVVYEGKNVFLLTIRNNTRKVYTTAPTSYTTSATAQRSCAEWVVEAPSLNGILPLSHFSPVTFTGCTAIINGAEGTINHRAWSKTAIDMKTNNHSIKAHTSALTPNGQGFSVNWNHE